MFWVGSNLAKGDMPTHNLLTHNFPTTICRLTICQKIFFGILLGFLSICRKRNNHAGLLVAPFSRKPLLPLYCSIVGHCTSLKQHQPCQNDVLANRDLANCVLANHDSANCDLTADNMKMLNFWQIMSRQIVVGKLNRFGIFFGTS